MSKQHVHAVVDRGGYVYRGQSIPKGRVVRMSEATFDETQRVQPSYYRPATAEEVEKAETILDLASVESPTAQNVAEARAAETAPAPTRKK